jgi:hypothetical protein
MDKKIKDEFKFFSNFQIIYNLKQQTQSSEKISKQLENISNLTLKDWDLKVERGRIEIFQLFEEFTPHFSLNNNRFEIFISQERIKINFPEDDFFHIKGPKGIFRVLNFPQNITDKPCSNEELREINDLLNIVILSKMGVSETLELESISINFSSKLEQRVDFKKLNTLSEKFHYDVVSLDFQVKEEKNLYMIEFLTDERIRCVFDFKDFRFNTPLSKILTTTQNKLIEILEDMINE